MNIRQLMAVGIAVTCFMVLALSLGSLVEHVSPNEIAVFQSPSGKMSVVTDPGWKMQMFAKVTKFSRSFQYGFEGGEKLAIRFNDGGDGEVHGSIRVDLPLEESKVIDLYRSYGSQSAVHDQLIRSVMEKSIYMTGPLLSSKESYAEKRNEMISFIEDQAKFGVYQTVSKITKTTDELTKDERMITTVEIKRDKDGKAMRQEESPIERFGVRLYNLSLNSIDYSDRVEKQIQSQQDAIMQVQTAIANSKRAEQEKLTTESQGAANAAKAKWEQETLNAKFITEAEGRKKIAQANKEAAEFEKQAMILKGEGEAKARELVMSADGALDKKLEAWKEVNFKYAENLGKQPIVPSIIFGSSATSASADQFMQMLMMGKAKELALEIQQKK